MSKKTKDNSASIWLKSGYRFDIYYTGDIMDSLCSDWFDIIEKEGGTFWLGNWGDNIEAYLYDPKGNHIEKFEREDKMPSIIINQVITYIGI